MTGDCLVITNGPSREEVDSLLSLGGPIPIELDFAFKKSDEDTAVRIISITVSAIFRENFGDEAIIIGWNRRGICDFCYCNYDFRNRKGHIRFGDQPHYLARS